MELNDLTEKIIGAAHKVLFTLKPGLDERLYERALAIELTKQGLRCESQRQFEVHYGDTAISPPLRDSILAGGHWVDGLASSLSRSPCAS